jgi:Glycosyl hydrolase family 26
MTRKAAVIAAALAAAASVTLSACATGGSGAGRAHGGGPAPAPRQHAYRLPGVPSGARLPHARSYRHLVPTTGAYLGAYVQPDNYTYQEQISAVLTLEHQLGHPMTLVHVYRPWTSPFPDPADFYFAQHGKVLLLTWGGKPDTRAIIAGRYDAMIRARAQALASLHRPVLLEWRDEMDRPNLQWAVHGPAGYIAAWKHIRRIFSAAHTNNVSWVWCPTAEGFTYGQAQDYYPGDGEVDWLCTDAYSKTPAEPLSEVLSAFLAWASHHPKPIVIGEFGARRDPAGWPPWLAEVGRLVKQDTQIKALAYFDADGIAGSGFYYSYSLSHRPAAMSAFAALLREPYFRPHPAAVARN